MMNLSSLTEQLSQLPFTERLQALCAAARDKHIAFSTSFSLEDQVITYLIARYNLPVRVFTLDTGRLFEETYTTFHATRQAYPMVEIFSYYPDAASLEQLVRKQGVNGFYESVEKRKNCCHVRKVEPLERALAGVDIWISGLRHAHSEHRQHLPFVEEDVQRGLLKCYPLLDVDEAELREFIVTHEIPYNSLHDKGFPSIGCAPCTRAVAAGEHPRSGRWWWEQEGTQECGLHLVDGKLVRVKQGESHA